MIHTLVLSEPDTPSAYFAAQFLGGFFRAAVSRPALRLACALLVVLLVGCGSVPPKLPYPAFIQASELPDVFVAGLPGIRAKQFSGNPQTRRSSNRLLLPVEWKGTTGASPGKSVEMFVLAGHIVLGDVGLSAGAYAYIPPGFTGANISTKSGAVVLYFLDDPDPNAVIQTPILLDSGIVDWQPLSDDPKDVGLSVKELRSDPGSGATTWLFRIEPGATQRWQQSSAVEEGYLLSGAYQHSECINGEVVTAPYEVGGYFQRPPGTVHAGPDAIATATTVWLLRRIGKGFVEYVDACVVTLSVS